MSRIASRSLQHQSRDNTNIDAKVQKSAKPEAADGAKRGKEARASRRGRTRYPPSLMVTTKLCLRSEMLIS